MRWYQFCFGLIQVCLTEKSTIINLYENKLTNLRSHSQKNQTNFV